MNRCRKMVAVALVFCLYHLSLIKSLTAGTTFTPTSIRQRVEAFGVGAKVGLKLAGGKKLHGTVELIDDRGFTLSQGSGPAKSIAYDEVGQLSLAERAYHAKGQPDPVDARRIVLNLGVGKHAVVRFGDNEFHGHIQSIEAEHFTLLPDHETAPVQIAYRDVQYVEKNLSLGATVVLIVLIAAAVVVAAAVAATR